MVKIRETGLFLALSINQSLLKCDWSKMLLLQQDTGCFGYQHLVPYPDLAKLRKAGQASKGDGIHNNVRLHVKQQ